MAQPTLNDLHVNAVLTNISIAYRNKSFIADQVFPLVSVPKQSDIYAKYTKADWFRDEAVLRAPGEEVKRTGWNVDVTNTYYCQNYAVGHDIPDEIRAGADSLYALDREATLWVTHQMQIRREVKFFAEFFATSYWGTTLSNSGGDKWDVYASSNPIVQVRTGSETILQNTGLMPNTLVLGYNVFNALLDHPDILDRMKYTQFGETTEAILARVFNVDRVLIARAVYNSAQEGATISMGFAATTSALLCYVAPRPALMEASAGYTFVWNPMGGSGPQLINQRRDKSRYTDVIEALGWWDSVATATDCGYYFSATVS